MKANLIFVVLAVIFIISFGVFLYRLSQNPDPPTINSKLTKEQINKELTKKQPLTNN